MLKYLFGSDGGGGPGPGRGWRPLSVGEKEEAELGATSNLHLTALHCSQDLGAHAGVPPVFWGNKVREGGPCYQEGFGTGGRASAQEGR